jgi:TonB family protein
MKGRLLTAGCSLACVYVVAPIAVLAQCGAGSIGIEQLLSLHEVAIVFSGTVVGLERPGSTEMVTFHVERVWKGPVKEETTIYRPVPPSGDHSPLFERGSRYAVIAHRLDARERRDFAAPAREDTFGTNMCGDGSRPFLAAAEDLKRTGPGRPPVDLAAGIRRPSIVAPQKIKDVAPVYPESARAAGIRGTVIVEVTVDETGRVSRVSVLRSIPLLDQAAVDCVMKWEYLPTLVSGIPQPVVVTATVTFAP